MFRKYFQLGLPLMGSNTRSETMKILVGYPIHQSQLGLKGVLNLLPGYPQSITLPGYPSTRFISNHNHAEYIHYFLSQIWFISNNVMHVYTKILVLTWNISKLIHHEWSAAVQSKLSNKFKHGESYYFNCCINVRKAKMSVFFSRNARINRKTFFYRPQAQHAIY